MEDALGAAYPPKRFRNGQRPPDNPARRSEAGFAAAPVRLDAVYTTRRAPQPNGAARDDRLWG